MAEEGRRLSPDAGTSGGLDPDGWPALFVRNVLFLDPTKPPFVWGVQPAAAADRGPSAVDTPAAEAEQPLSARELRQLFKVRLSVGSVTADFWIRTLREGIAVCSEEGELKSVIKGNVIADAKYLGDRLTLTMAKKSDESVEQVFDIFFESSKLCRAFVRRMETVLKITAVAQVEAQAATAKRSTPQMKLKAVSIKDVLVLEGSGFTETRMTAMYQESQTPSNVAELRRNTPLYPFLKFNWFVSDQPGASPTYNEPYSLNNVMEFEVLSAMAGRFIRGEGALLSGKKLTATKGPVLPAVELAKRLLKVLVAGECSIRATLRAEIIDFIVNGLPDKFKLRMPPNDTEIACRLVLTPRSLTIALPKELLSTCKFVHGRNLSTDDLVLRFEWLECYFTLPSVYIESTKDIEQNEFATGHRLHLEFYAPDGESWVVSEIGFSDVAQRNLAWHYSVFMAASELAATSAREGPSRLPELLQLMPEFERDHRIGNVQGLQKAFKTLWNVLDYNEFKNSVRPPSMFSETVAERKEKAAKLQEKSSSTNRASAAAQRSSKREHGAPESKTRTRGGHYSDEEEEQVNESVAYEVFETADKGVDLQAWESSSSSEGGGAGVTRHG